MDYPWPGVDEARERLRAMRLEVKDGVEESSIEDMLELINHPKLDLSWDGLATAMGLLSKLHRDPSLGLADVAVINTIFAWAISFVLVSYFGFGDSPC